MFFVKLAFLFTVDTAFDPTVLQKKLEEIIIRVRGQ